MTSGIATVYLPQVSPGTHLSTNPKRMDEQLGGRCADCPGRDRTRARRFMARRADHCTTEEGEEGTERRKDKAMDSNKQLKIRGTIYTEEKRMWQGGK